MTAKPRRRWYQLSLRALFVVVTVLCVWLGWQVRTNRGERMSGHVETWIVLLVMLSPLAAMMLSASLAYRMIRGRARLWQFFVIIAVWAGVCAIFAPLLRQPTH